MDKRHRERHLVDRIGWLRAAVLGANDGIVSVGSLIVGIAASTVGRQELIVAGCAAWVAGAISMAAGEYVSVSSQADTEHADLARETVELRDYPVAEHRELTQIYVERGVERPLAEQVAAQLMAHDALAAHARDELGITAQLRARPLQAAWMSALAFTAGALPPLAVSIAAPRSFAAYAVGVSSVLLLAMLGAIGARAGGANPLRAAMRVTFWGVVAMLVTAAVGSLVGSAVPPS